MTQVWRNGIDLFHVRSSSGNELMILDSIESLKNASYPDSTELSLNTYNPEPNRNGDDPFKI